MKEYCIKIDKNTEIFSNRSDRNDEITQDEIINLSIDLETKKRNEIYNIYFSENDNDNYEPESICDILLKQNFLRCKDGN